MEARARIRGSEDIFGIVGGSAGEVASESSNGKRKVERAYGLFCVMRKTRCRHKCVDDDDDDDDIQNCESDLRFEYPDYLVDEDVIVDTDPSVSSEFDLVSDTGEFTGSKPLVSNLSSETQILLLVNEVNAATKKPQFVICSGHSNRNRNHISVIPCPCDGDDELKLQKISSNDELRLRNEGHEPMPISIVLPDGGGSSLLLQTCSLHETASCGNGYNVHDDKNGLGGTSRPCSVCSSLTAVKSSGACNSLDEQSCGHVSSSAQSQTPSLLYQQDADGEDEICFSDVDAMIRKLNLLPDDSGSQECNMSKHPRHTLIGSEHCTTTSFRRAIISHGAIAVLHSRGSKHLIRKHEVIIGRSSDGLNVDIDLGKDGYGSKISRRQALVKLENNGSFSLKNLGKRPILVNGEKLDTEEIVTLTSSSSIDIRGIVFAFKSNKEAVRQFLNKSKRRNREEDDPKFRWCE